MIYESKLQSMETKIPPSISPRSSDPELCSKDHGMGLTGLGEGTNTPRSPWGTNPAHWHRQPALWRAELVDIQFQWAWERRVWWNHISSDLQWKKTLLFRSNMQQRWRTIAVNATPTADRCAAHLLTVPKLHSSVIQFITWVWGKLSMNTEGRRWDLAHGIWHQLKNNTLFIILGDSITYQAPSQETCGKNHRFKEKWTCPQLPEDTSIPGAHPCTQRMLQQVGTRVSPAMDISSLATSQQR